MALYLVNVSVDVVIAAESFAHACQEARWHAADEIRDNGIRQADLCVSEIDGIECIPPSWRNACPRGGNGARCVDFFGAKEGK